MEQVNLYEILLLDPSSGKQIQIGTGEKAMLRLLEDGMTGFGPTQLIVDTESYADGTGAYPVKRQFGERYLSITAELIPSASADVHALRRKICAMLSPLATLEMQVTLGGVTRKIDVIPCGKPVFHQSTLFSPVEVFLPFVAPSPLYRAAKEEKIIFWQSLPMLTFPMNFMVGAGTAAGYYRNTDTATINNTGDGPCGFIAVITAVGGDIVNPCIVSGNRYIRLMLTLKEGESASVDTRPRQKNVWVNGERRFIFHRESDFFLLDVGDNIIRITADSGVENLSASLTYTPLYYGI